MATLFLIGNGFDLNCGMKTRFSDVYKEYLKTRSETRAIEKLKSSINKDIEKWGDFEMAMAKFASRLYSETEFLECIRDFSTFMENYLKEENDSFWTIYNKQNKGSVLEEMKKSMRYYYEGISHNVSHIMKQRDADSLSGNIVISFNYTDVFDRLYYGVMSSAVPAYSRVLHIHGVLGDDPVIGVDNINQLNVPYELSIDIQRDFIKPVFNQEYDANRVEQAKKMIGNADIICAYGMSWGPSDLTWRQEVINWLLNYKGANLFLFFKEYSDRKYGRKSEMLSIEDEARKGINEAWGLNDDVDLLKRIHIPCGINIFNIGNAISNNQNDDEKEIMEDV